MRALANLRTPIIALATVLAMLLVPSCGSVCAAMTHCSKSAVAANSDGCHHTDSFAQSDSEAHSISSDAICGQQTPRFAILTSSDSTVLLGSVPTANALVSIDTETLAFMQDRQVHDFLPSKDSPQQSIPLVNPSVLRI